MIKKVKKGFTLIELVVVIAVIAILSAVSVVAYVGITNSAKSSVAEQEAGTVKTLLRTELTRSAYVYKDAVDATKTVTFELKDEKIEYQIANSADLSVGLENLIYTAQGLEGVEYTNDKYEVIEEDDSASGDNFGVMIEKDSVSHKPVRLSLVHPNGKSAVIFLFGEKTSA